MPVILERLSVLRELRDKLWVVEREKVDGSYRGEDDENIPRGQAVLHSIIRECNELAAKNRAFYLE
jgi:hypothetical protein